MAAIGATSDPQFLVEKRPMRGLRPEGYGQKGRPDVNEPNYQAAVAVVLPAPNKKE